MEDTKVLYHIDDEDTPYLVKLPVSPEEVTLADLKNALNKPTYKFFFKSVDADFGSTKIQETPLIDKTTDLSYDQDYVIEISHDASDRDSDSAHSGDRLPPLKNFRKYKPGSGPRKSSHRVSSNYESASSMMSSDLESTSFFDSEDDSSRFSSVTGTTMSSLKYARNRRLRRRRRLLPPQAVSGAARRIVEDTASTFSSSSMTDSTMSLNVITVTLNLQAANAVNFLGISIVGQSNKAGDGGIYVGSIMRGGAVALDGRIEPGDMILEVNRISFEELTNDGAVRVLREQVQKPGPITLVVAKCWDPSPKNHLAGIPRQEPIQPIDPHAWVLHTNAMTAEDGQQVNSPPVANNPAGPPPPVQTSVANGAYPGFTSVNTNANNLLLSSPPQPQSAVILMSARQPTSRLLPTPSNVTSKSLPEPCHLTSNNGGGPGSSASHLFHPLDVNKANDGNPLVTSSDMTLVVRTLLQPDSGLDVHDRSWLKLTIPSAFIGSDLVDWLFTHVDGFADRRDARRYAVNLLNYGYIRHTVNKTSFSEQCYYIFTDLATALCQLAIDDIDSVSVIGGNGATVPPTSSSNRLILPSGHQSTAMGTGLPQPASLSVSSAPPTHPPTHNTPEAPSSSTFSQQHQMIIGPPTDDPNRPPIGPHYPYPPILFHPLPAANIQSARPTVVPAPFGQHPLVVTSQSGQQSLRPALTGTDAAKTSCKQINTNSSSASSSCSDSSSSSGSSCSCSPSTTANGLPLNSSSSNPSGGIFLDHHQASAGRYKSTRLSAHSLSAGSNSTGTSSTTRKQGTGASNSTTGSAENGSTNNRHPRPQQPRWPQQAPVGRLGGKLSSFTGNDFQQQPGMSSTTANRHG